MIEEAKKVYSQKLSLLLKPIWDYKDIKDYFGFKSPTMAYQYKDRAFKEKNGYVDFSDKYVKTDAVLALFGTNRESEIKILKGTLDEETIQERNL